MALSQPRSNDANLPGKKEGRILNKRSLSILFGEKEEQSKEKKSTTAGGPQSFAKGGGDRLGFRSRERGT